jgi:hypothetical protein
VTIPIRRTGRALAAGRRHLHRSRANVKALRHAETQGLRSCQPGRTGFDPCPAADHLRAARRNGLAAPRFLSYFVHTAQSFPEAASVQPAPGDQLPGPIFMATFPFTMAA